MSLTSASTPTIEVPSIDNTLEALTTEFGMGDDGTGTGTNAMDLEYTLLMVVLLPITLRRQRKPIRFQKITTTAMELLQLQQKKRNLSTTIGSKLTILRSDSLATTTSQPVKLVGNDRRQQQQRPRSRNHRQTKSTTARPKNK